MSEELKKELDELFNEKENNKEINIPPFMPFYHTDDSTWIMGLLVLLLMDNKKETPIINIYLGDGE